MDVSVACVLIRIVVAAVMAVGLGVGCTTSSDPAPGAEIAITTAVDPGPVPVIRELKDPTEVEAFVQEFGRCAMGDVPGAGLEIAFDPTSGFVGGTRSAASTRARLDQLGEAMHICNFEMGFRVSVDAFAVASPAASAFLSTGLEPAPGRRIVFGDSSFFNE